MSRPLHPLACRIGRAERARVVAFAHSHGMSVSGLLKEALRNYIGSQPAAVGVAAVAVAAVTVTVPAVATQPTVHGPVNRLSDSFSSPPPLAPYRLPRSPQSRARVVQSGVAKARVLLSDC